MQALKGEIKNGLGKLQRNQYFWHALKRTTVRDKYKKNCILENLYFNFLNIILISQTNLRNIM